MAPLRSLRQEQSPRGEGRGRLHPSRAPRALLSAAALYHLACVLYLLAKQAVHPPFSALLRTPARPPTPPQTIALMHHKRIPELNATLHKIAKIPRASNLLIIVSQTLPEGEEASFEQTRKLLDTLTHLPMKLEHTTNLVALKNSGVESYSIDARRFGNKKNSIRNMLHGVSKAFEKLGEDGNLQFLTVMEDDVEVSPDVLDYFEFAASLMDGTRDLPEEDRVVLASSFCILRSDHRDYRRPMYPSSLFVPKDARYFSRMHFQHITFKTFAWLMTRDVYVSMRADFSSMLQQPGNSTELHPSLKGCPYCENFCYDHYLEWRWRHASLACPEIPRSRQLLIGAGGGMTEKPGDATAMGSVGLQARRRAGFELNSEFVHSWQFVDDSNARRASRLLDKLCAWLMPIMVIWAGLVLNRVCRLGGPKCIDAMSVRSAQADSKLDRRL